MTDSMAQKAIEEQIDGVYRAAATKVVNAEKTQTQLNEEPVSKHS